jgi:enamine deaminase RidA (YjgF/YER057c/UK114 family)
MAKITKLNTGGYYEGRHHYSKAVVIDDWIMLSTSAGLDPKTGEFPGSPEDQAEQLMANIELFLNKVGSTLADVVQVRAFIPDRANLFPVMDRVMSKFDGIDPACTLLCTPLGSDLYKVELEITAYRGAGAAEQVRLHEPIFNSKRPAE